MLSASFGHWWCPYPTPRRWSSQWFLQFIRPNNFKDTIWWLQNTKLLLRRFYLNTHASNAAHVDYNCSIYYIWTSIWFNENIFHYDSRGKQCAKEMLHSDHGNFYPNPLKLEMNNSSAFKWLSVPIPHDGPAHFKQLFVPTTTASTGLQSILNDVIETSIWHQAFDNTLSRRPIMNISNIFSVPHYTCYWPQVICIQPVAWRLTLMQPQQVFCCFMSKMAQKLQ